MTGPSISMPKRGTDAQNNVPIAIATADRRAPSVHVQPGSPADDALQLSENELDGALRLLPHR